MLRKTLPREHIRDTINRYIEKHDTGTHVDAEIRKALISLGSSLLNSDDAPGAYAGFRYTEPPHMKLTEDGYARSTYDGTRIRFY